MTIALATSMLSGCGSKNEKVSITIGNWPTKEQTSYRFNEKQAPKDRWTSKNDDKGDNLETMENSQEKRMGIDETRSWEMDSPQGCKLG